VASLVYLATRRNSKLVAELTLAGHRVFDALDVSQALYHCENARIDAIVIASEMEDFTEAQLRYITIRLKPEASAKELIWELSHLFPDEKASIQ
jgi:hypothetical protein